MVEGIAWLKNRREGQQSAQRTTDPVAGELYGHPGHAWMRVLGRDRAAIGIDGFALRLLGKVDEACLPRRADETLGELRNSAILVED